MIWWSELPSTNSRYYVICVALVLHRSDLVKVHFFMIIHLRCGISYNLLMLFACDIEVLGICFTVEYDVTILITTSRPNAVCAGHRV